MEAPQPFGGIPPTAHLDRLLSQISQAASKKLLEPELPTAMSFHRTPLVQFDTQLGIIRQL